MRCDGKKIVELRKVEGWSQQDLCDKSKLSRSSVQRAEKGGPVDYQTIHEIASALGVPFQSLALTEDGNPLDETVPVPLRPLASGKELVEVILRCDQVRLDLLDDLPDEASLFSVRNTLADMEDYLPGTAKFQWEIVQGWRTHASERLYAIERCQSQLTGLKEDGVHLLLGEYVAEMNEFEAAGEAQNYVDMLEVQDITGIQPESPNYTKRVGVLLLARLDRTAYNLPVDDRFMPREPSQSGSGARDEDFYDPDIPF